MKDPKLKFQYNVNKNASAYEKDRDALNKFLQGHPEIKWSEYDAQFCDAKITLERENARSFGVGYVKNLEDFEKQVEGDLMESILSNYSSIDTTQVDNYALESIQHRNAVKLKAATFVGRTGLVNKAYQHCVTSGYPNTLILHGEPGCGKSGLLAKIAVDCMSQVEKTNDFLFIQAVDSCPGSSLLEGMMRRLQINLRKYRRDRGETKLSIEFTGNASELKQKHHEFLIESANQYPDKLFVIVIDAVNQFQSRLGAWDMWWLPLKDAPKNLKFMISTLNQENGTFQNARNVSPDAECVPVENMSHEDLKEMVRETLARFNKKLTENEDSKVGNQMEILLSKSQSPLYLIAACEALRKFGIFEKVTQYIENLPNTITDLFSFLLDDWSITYGKLFVHDVAGFICVSKDGLLENQINDLLHYKEQREKGDGQFLYDANFPRIYDSISHFLAAGGGGYLRFFHDQLKYAVRRKFMTESFEQETHACMRDFFQDIIIKQCCETPQVEPPAYFDHILEQLVYHQLKAHQNQDTPLESLKISLRNIYFVKNRIVAKQQQSLSDDYSVALATLKDTEDLEALKQWASFVQLYTPYIQELPNFSLNMAVTQSPNSFVTKDTLSLGMEPLVKGEAYPLYWTNIPMEGDSMLVKYCRGGVCVSANAKRDIVAITGDEFTAVYDMISGELIHDFKTIGSAVSISSDGKTLILGGYSGRISRYNISKGTLEDVVKIFEKDLCTSWLTCTGDNLLACWNEINIHVDSNERYIATWITVLDKNSLKIVKKWCTEKPGFDCCYNERLNMIFSAHLGGDIIGWDLQGNQLCSATFDCDVIHCLSFHPTENKIISGSDDYIIREWSVTKSSVELCNQIEDDDDIDIKSPLHRGHKSVCYDDIGERILTIRFRRKELRIFNISGELLKEMKGHAASIEYMSLVPGKNQVLSSANLHETILWQLPVTKESKKNTVPKMVEEIVRWCAFTKDGTQFLTLAEGWLRLYDTATLELKLSREAAKSTQLRGVLHPDGTHVIIFSNTTKIACFKVGELEPVSEYEYFIPEDNTCLSFMDLDDAGSNLIVTGNQEYSGVAKVLDVSDLKIFKEKMLLEGFSKRMHACAINRAGDLGCVSGYFNGFMAFDLTNGTIKYYVQHAYRIIGGFFSNNCLLCIDDNYNFFKYDPESEKDVCEYKGHTHLCRDATFLNEERQVMTVSIDGTLRIFDTETGENIYGFFNHRAQRYTCLAAHPSEKIFLAASENSMVYVLKTTPDFV